MKERLLASSSSKKADTTKTRWTEVEIARGDRGYIIREIGRSSVAGETDRVREAVCQTGADVMAALTSGTSGKLSRTALVALRDAGKADVGFRDVIAPVLPEDLTPVSYQPRSARRKGTGEGVFVIEYDAEEERRPIRFQGTLIGGGTSRTDESTSWTTVHLYRTIDGRYVAVKDHRDATETGEERAIARKIVVAKTGAEIARAFTREGRGWVEGALLDALEQARDVEPTLDDEIGPDVVTDVWAHELVGSTEVRPGDARYAVLDYLEGGGRLVTIGTAEGPQPLGFVMPAGAAKGAAPELSPRLIRTLSLQALLWRDHDKESAVVWAHLPPAIKQATGAALTPHAVAAWFISPKGREVLERARARMKRSLSAAEAKATV